MSALSEILNARRKDAGMNLEDVWLALRERGSGVGFSTVGHWFSGRGKPRSMEDLRRLCEVLDLDLDLRTMSPPHLALTAEAEEVVEAMRTMDPQQVQALVALARSMKRR